MSYRLIVIPPRGGERYQANTAPLENREAVGMAALRALAAEGVRFGIAGLSFGRSVASADVGAVVTHEESGFSFEIKEF